MTSSVSVIVDAAVAAQTLTDIPVTVPTISTDLPVIKKQKTQRELVYWIDEATWDQLLDIIIEEQPWSKPKGARSIDAAWDAVAVACCGVVRIATTAESRPRGRQLRDKLKRDIGIVNSRSSRQSGGRSFTASVQQKLLECHNLQRKYELNQKVARGERLTEEEKKMKEDLQLQMDDHRRATQSLSERAASPASQISSGSGSNTPTNKRQKTSVDIALESIAETQKQMVAMLARVLEGKPAGS